MYAAEVRPLLTILLIVCLSWSSPACRVKKVVQVDPTEVGLQQSEMIVGATTKNGEEISFDASGAKIIDQTLQGFVHGVPYHVPVSEVQRFWVTREETSTIRTVGLIAAVAGGALLVTAAVVAATKNSCPFVYTWNGSRYSFNAEPFGGAITRGLERDDFARLEDLVPDGGRYRLLLRNEVPETQYVNLMQLQLVDHTPGHEVGVDGSGRFLSLDAPEAPVSATDREGNDLTMWLSETDRLVWEPEPVSDSAADLVQEINLTFRKPAQARVAKLVANVATGLWGSYMIREFLKLRGRELDYWYQSVDRDLDKAESIHQWIRRGQMYALEILVAEPTGWQPRGYLLGEGPFLAEDRIVVLDVSRVRGEWLRIRLRPPVGFWAFNSLRLDYSPVRELRAINLLPSSAIANGGHDIRSDLSAVDSSYYEMPRRGDFAFLEYEVPPKPQGLNRTAFLHSRGYYRIHLQGIGDPDSAVLRQLEETPGTGVQLSAFLFSRWDSLNLRIGP